jgi:hypothetical protein
MSFSAPCYLSASSISVYRRVLHPEVSAFFTTVPLSVVILGNLTFSPSPPIGGYYGLCWLLINKPCIAACSCSFGRRFSLRPLFIRSPRVRTQTFSPYTCQIYSPMFRIVLGFVLFSKLTHIRLPDLLPVRQAGDLPPTSFRFAVARDTIAFG